jgi:hypothetical protein
VRDVRDFLLSYKNKWRYTGEENAARVKRLYHPVVTTLLWKASIKRIIRLKDEIPRENLMLVQYEKLVQNPAQLVRQICRFIGEVFEEDMLNVQEGNSSFEIAKTGIYSTSVGRWQRLLTNEEVYVAQNIARRRLTDLGYITVNLKVNPLKLAYMYATLPYGLWRAVQANRNMRGPLLPYIGTRLLALWQS